MMENSEKTMCGNEASRSFWSLRAAVAEFLAFSLAYPTSDHAEMIASGEWLDAATDMAAELHVPWLKSEWEDGLANGIDETPAADAQALLGSLRAESTRLFVGAPTPLVSPYEGIWRAREDGVEGLLFVNPHSMGVERFVKACGLGRPDGTNEPLDHVVTEFELLSYLASLASGEEAPEDAIPADMLPEGNPGSAYRRFFAEHSSTWFPPFAMALGKQTRLPYYRAVAVLLEMSLPCISAV